MDSPTADALLAAVAHLELYAKARIAHNSTEEFERLLKLADDMATARQLANYGVKL